MPCYNTKGGVQPPIFVPLGGRKMYATEADCLQACKEGACCEGTTCSVKPQCQCQGAGKVFNGVGTVCSPNPCLACYSCLPSHPSYVTVSFSQTAPITGGFLESVINLSGSYSVPSVSTSSDACQFCGSFSKTYPNALPSNFINRDMVVSFRVTVAFANTTQAAAIAIYGTLLDANEIGSRAPGLYQFAVMTGEVGGLSFSGCAYGGAAQMQSFAICSANSYVARQRGWTNSPTSQYPYRIEYNQTTVDCGTLSWSQ